MHTRTAMQYGGTTFRKNTSETGPGRERQVTLFLSSVSSSRLNAGFLAAPQMGECSDAAPTRTPRLRPPSNQPLMIR